MTVFPPDANDAFPPVLTLLVWLLTGFPHICITDDSVKIGDACSPLSDITSGVPQGSVHGPILFALYTLPISTIADAHSVLQQQYADDTQLYISVSAKTIAPNTRGLEACLSDLHAWFSHNWLALNPSKSEALPLGTGQRLKTLATIGSVNISGTTVPLTTQIKLLGVTLDQSLSFDSHITALSKSCFYHIRALGHIRPILSECTANLIASALVSSRLDYANACLFGISNKNLSRIQRIQITLARVVTFSRSRSSTATLLKHLHWLPVSVRINFKIALLTFKSLHAIAPLYLSSLVRPYVPSRALRSSSAHQHQLCVPHVSTVFSSRGFRSALPFGIPYRSQLRRAPLSIPSRNNLRHTCLLQPSPLVELSSMRL